MYNKTKNLVFLLFLLLIIGGAFFFPTISYGQDTITSAAEGGAAFVKFLNWLFSALLSVAAILAFAMIVLGGVRWIMAAGSPETINNAKGMITNAVIGLILAFAAWLILNTINPALVGLGKGGLFETSPSDPITDQPIQIGWYCGGNNNFYTDEQSCSQACTNVINGMKFSCQKISGTDLAGWMCNIFPIETPTGPYHSKGQCGLFCDNFSTKLITETGEKCEWKGEGSPPQEEIQIAYRCRIDNTVWPMKD